MRRPEWEVPWRLARHDRRQVPSRLKRDKLREQRIDRETREEIAQLTQEKLTDDRN